MPEALRGRPLGHRVRNAAEVLSGRGNAILARVPLVNGLWPLSSRSLNVCVGTGEGVRRAAAGAHRPLRVRSSVCGNGVPFSLFLSSDKGQFLFEAIQIVTSCSVTMDNF